MPRFVLRVNPEPNPPVEVGLNITTGGTVEIVMECKGNSNLIGYFTSDGRLCLYGLIRSWAEQAGIRIDAEGKIQIV